jgi:antitoxin component YwqK of YwqJK toxin-antitoxin module
LVWLASLGLATTALSEEPRRFARPGDSARRIPQQKSESQGPALEETLAVEAAPAIQETPIIDATALPEIIRERYPNRAVRVERHVVQDVQLNYVNHGPWAWYDERGQLLARGEYNLGKQHGKWTRIHTVDKGTVFALPIYRGFERPFTSEAFFENGVLTGAWTVVDAKGRKASQSTFQQGKQHGLATWWHPNGQTHRTANYVNGQIDGELREYGLKGELLVKETYVEGCKLDLEVNNHSKDRRRSERNVLVPIAKEHHNWFQATVTLERVERPKIYHGVSTWWYADGQKEMAGKYEQGVPAGEFIWWHANGQERSRGNYVDGKQDGRWTWWHANGQKEMEGEYRLGHRVGKWASWNEDGKVRLVEDHPEPDQVPTIATAPDEDEITR